MKNYDCMQGFLQLIIIFFMQEIGGNIWWFNVSFLNLFKSQNYSIFSWYQRFFLACSGVSCMLKAKDRSHEDQIKAKNSCSSHNNAIISLILFYNTENVIFHTGQKICWLIVPLTWLKARELAYIQLPKWVNPLALHWSLTNKLVKLNICLEADGILTSTNHWHQNVIKVRS